MADFEEKLLKTLESIDCALKRIEQSLTAEKQHEVVKEAVSHAVLGEKGNLSAKEQGGYLMEAVQTAIHDTFQEEEKK